MPAPSLSLKDSAYQQFRDFLKSLRRKYADYRGMHEKEIREYMDNTSLWHNQFMYVHHIKTGKFFQKGFDTALGYKMENLTAERLVRIIHPTDLDKYFKISKALLSFVMDHARELIPFESSFSINYRVRKDNGEYVSILRQSTPLIKNGSGEVEAYISMCTEINDLINKHQVRWNIYGPKSECFDEYLEQYLNPKDDLFTSREIDVLELLGEGYTSREISNELHISVNTVNSHRKKLMKKANVNKTVDLIMYAKENGYLL